MCLKILAAVRELEPTYNDRIDFVVISALETAKRQLEIEAFGFKDQKHGLVAFAGDKTAVVKLPGHSYGRPEVEAAILAILPRGR